MNSVGLLTVSLDVEVVILIRSSKSFTSQLFDAVHAHPLVLHVVLLLIVVTHQGIRLSESLLRVLRDEVGGVRVESLVGTCNLSLFHS